MWTLASCTDLSACWIERRIGRLTAHVGIVNAPGVSFYITFCVDDIDEWFSVGDASSIEEAKEIAEAVAVQWLFDEHERGLSALESEAA